MSEVENTTETTQETSTATEQAPAELTINDLNSLKVIIDIASSRGVFKPTEYAAVGQTYTKLSTFLEQVAKQADSTGGQ